MLAVLYYGVDADWFVQINVKTCELCILLPISTKNEILACNAQPGTARNASIAFATSLTAFNGTSLNVMEPSLFVVCVTNATSTLLLASTATEL